jgi:DNA primase
MSDQPEPVSPNGSSFLPRLRALAASGTNGLQTNAQWEAWLRRAERFSQFGFENTMLIWAQAPDAVLLNTYASWRRQGRQVIAGSSAIRLITPGKNGAENVRTFFDLYQTEGQPVRVPQPRGALNDIGADGHVWKTLEDLASRSGFCVVVTREDSLAGIDWEQKLIGIRSGGDRVADLVHQVSHMLLGSADCTGVRKVEADSLGYLIRRRFGMDTSAITFPYVTSWTGSDPRTDRARITAGTTERITAAASQAFACIDGNPHAVEKAVTGPCRASSASAAARPEAPRPAGPLRGERARTLALVQEEAQRFFVGQARRRWVPAYLGQRGFDATARRDWGTGYAPGTWTAVTDHLRGRGFPDDIIEASGLAKRSSRRTLIDVFRDRSVFPVRVPDGTIVGFIGRCAPDAGKDVPRYLNSRETEIYSKGRVLFGLSEGVPALSAGAVPVIVEGPVDAMAVTVAGAGPYAGVAPCGTAFTAQQLGALASACDLRSRGVLAAFDADKAGQKAAVRAYDLLSGVASRPMTVVLPSGQDPAGLFASHGGQALSLALDHLARPLADTVIDARLAKHASSLDSVDGQFGALRAVAPVIAHMPPIEWPRQAIRVSAQIGLTPTEVSDAVTRALSSAAEPRAGPGPGRAAALAAQDSPGLPAVTTVAQLPAGNAGVPARRPALTPAQTWRSIQ